MESKTDGDHAVFSKRSAICRVDISYFFVFWCGDPFGTFVHVTCVFAFVIQRHIVFKDVLRQGGMDAKKTSHVHHPMGKMGSMGTHQHL